VHYLQTPPKDGLLQFDRGTLSMNHQKNLFQHQKTGDHLQWQMLIAKNHL
jgi:hypothetical protein